MISHLGIAIFLATIASMCAYHSLGTAYVLLGMTAALQLLAAWRDRDH